MANVDMRDWVQWRFEEFLKIELEAKENKEEENRLRLLRGDPPVYEVAEDRDPDTQVFEAWTFVKNEAAKLTPENVATYGGELFKSMIAREITDLISIYPTILEDAQKSCDKQRKNSGKKRRRVDETNDSSSAAGGSAGGAAGGGGAVLGARAVAEYENRIKEFEDQLERAKGNSELYRLKAEMAEAEIAKLKGQNLELPQDELRALLGDVAYALGRISDSVHLDGVKEKLEEQGILCCPISQELLKDPVAAPDGYVYERTHIERWITEQLDKNEHSHLHGYWKSPCGSQCFASQALPTAITVKSLISERIEEELRRKRVEVVSR